MKLESFTVRNFMCFGENGSTIHFAPITMLYGANNSGKTALLKAMQLGRDILIEGRLTESLGPFPYFVHRQDITRKITLIFGTDEGEVKIEIFWDADADEPFVMVGATTKDVLEYVRKRVRRAVFMKRREHCPRDLSGISENEWCNGLVAWRLLRESKELRDLVNAEMKRVCGDDWDGELMDMMGELVFVKTKEERC